MKPATEKAIDRFCLVANGSSGAWDVSIDEAVKGDEKWYVEIEGPSAYLTFQLVDLHIIDQMIAFLDKRTSTDDRPRNGGSNDLTIGHFGRASVTLIWDTEFADRCYLVIGPRSSCCMRFTLLGEDARMILDALRQVRQDLPQ